MRKKFLILFLLVICGFYLFSYLYTIYNKDSQSTAKNMDNTLSENYKIDKNPTASFFSKDSGLKDTIKAEKSSEETPFKRYIEEDKTPTGVVSRKELGLEEVILEKDNLDIFNKNETYELMVTHYKLTTVDLKKESKNLLFFENDKIMVLDIILKLKNISGSEMDTSQNLAQILVNDDINASTMLDFLDNSESRVIKPGEIREVSVTFVFDLEELPEIEKFKLKFDNIEAEIEV